MKAVPMRGKLTGKRISGHMWAGPGNSWMRKENYFQLEDDRLVTAIFGTPSGSLEIRCRGATFRMLLKGPEGQVLSTAVLALPRGRKVVAVQPIEEITRGRKRRRKRKAPRARRSMKR